MHPKEAIRQTLRISDAIVGTYLDGLDDADLLVRPVAGMNPLAWQLGHLVSVERRIVEAIRPGSCPPLPDGFDEAHGMGKGQADDFAGFAPLAEYRALWEAQRGATLAALDAQTDQDLDRDTPIERLRHRAKTVGEVFNFVGLHTMLHVGQFVAVRRATAKPVAF